MVDRETFRVLHEHDLEPRRLLQPQFEYDPSAGKFRAWQARVEHEPTVWKPFTLNYEYDPGRWTFRRRIPLIDAGADFEHPESHEEYKRDYPTEGINLSGQPQELFVDNRSAERHYGRA